MNNYRITRKYILDNKQKQLIKAYINGLYSESELAKRLCRSGLEDIKQQSAHRLAMNMMRQWKQEGKEWQWVNEEI